MVKNVFVVGLDKMSGESLRRIPGADDIRFHELLSRTELNDDILSVPKLLEKTHQRLNVFTGSIDAIIGFWDFPASVLVPILCEHYGLTGTSLRSVVVSEHKFWSRLKQQQVIEEIPNFGILDLTTTVPHLPGHLDFPVWVKPVKSVASEGAFYVRSVAELTEAKRLMQAQLDRMGDPFDEVLAMLDLPAEIAAVGGRACIVEEPALGRQVTVEGFVRSGAVTVYGIVDSFNYPDSSSFLRYQYPAQLPETISSQLVTLTERVVQTMELDHTTFNIEYFWDTDTNLLRLLEINVRHSQSHALLFEMVDGAPNHTFIVDLALGREPYSQRGAGPYALAAKSFLRYFHDGIVTRAPSPEEVSALEAQYPGTVITIGVQPGDRLSEFHGEDSYSYVLAEIYAGGQTEDEIEAIYAACIAGLSFEIERVPEAVRSVTSGLQEVAEVHSIMPALVAKEAPTQPA